MMPPLSATLEATVREIEAALPDPAARADALIGAASRLVEEPRSVQDLHDAHALYERAESCAPRGSIAGARAAAGRGVVLRRLPGRGLAQLELSRALFESALTTLRTAGDPDEIAQIEMSHGLSLHALANAGKAPVGQAVAAYQRALRTFKVETHPREFATLHLNLATAHLAMRTPADKEGLREALAAQSFREALKVVTRENEPVEYGMLQNNLGNALQAMSGEGRFDALARAVEAYDEALSVRPRREMPLEHASTLANKAHALMKLPDDLDDPEGGNLKNVRQAISLLKDAASLFRELGEHDRADIVADLADDLRREIA